MLKNDETPSNFSKRGQKGRTAIAISVGACLVMGILALEVMRREKLDDSKSEKNGQTLIILKNPDDLRLHRDLAQLESRVHESKRLLFSRENALESKRIQTLRERLQLAESYAEELEKKNDELKGAFNQEKQKLSDFEKTSLALVDTIELQKASKESTQQKLMEQIEHLKNEYEQATQENKEAFTEKLFQLESNLSQTKEAYEEAQQDLSQLQSRYQAIESLLAQKEDETSSLYTQLLEKQLERDKIAYESDTSIQNAGASLAELEKAYALEKAASENALFELNQQASKHVLNQIELKATLEQNIADLKLQIEDREKAIQELAQADQEKELTLAELKRVIEAEITKSEELKESYENRPPIRDLEKEEALENQLAYERECALRIQHDLARQMEINQQVTQEITMLEGSLIESRTHSSEFSAKELALKQEIERLEGVILQDETNYQELSDLLKNQQQQQRILKEYIDHINEELVKTKEVREEEAFKQMQALLSLKETLENSHKATEEERSQNLSLEQEVSRLTNLIANFELAQEDVQNHHLLEIKALEDTLIRTKSDSESISYNLQLEQAKQTSLLETIALLENQIATAAQEYALKDQQAHNLLESYEANLHELETALDLKEQDLLRGVAQKEAAERELAELQVQFDRALTETERVRYAVHELESRPPLRDTSREEWLLGELEAQEQAFIALKERLNSSEALTKELMHEKQALEASIHENKEVLTRASEKDRELKSKIADLEEALNTSNFDDVESPASE